MCQKDVASIQDDFAAFKSSLQQVGQVVTPALEYETGSSKAAWACNSLILNFQLCFHSQNLIYLPPTFHTEIISFSQQC